MRRGLLLLGAVAVVALLGIAALFALGPGADDDGQPVAAARDGQAPGDDAATGRAHVAVSAHESPAADAEHPVEPAPPPVEVVEREIVEGRLVRADGGATGGAVVRVRAIHEGLGLSDWISTTSDASGAFSVDVTDVFDGGKIVAEFEVAADHPRCLPAAVRAVPADPQRDADGVRRHGIDVALAPCVVVTGRVVDPSGAPVVGADVGCFVVSSGSPEDGAIRTTSDADGRFAARAPPGTPLLLVAVAEDLAPGSAPVEGGTPDTEVVAPDVRLGAGAEIAGRVVAEDGTPLAGVDVGARRSVSVYLRLGGGLTWRDGVVARPGVTTRTDAQGRFRLRGLHPGAHRVTASPDGGLGFGDLPPHEVDAPARDVEIVIERAHVELLVLADGVAAPKLVVMVACGVFTMLETDESGRLRLTCPPGAEIGVRVSRSVEYAELEAEFTAPAAGETERHTLALVRRAATGALVVRLRGPDGRAIDRAGIGLWPEGSEESLVPPVRQDELVAGETDGVLRMEGIDAGAYRILIRPGGALWGTSAYFMEIRTRVTIPVDGDALLEPIVAVAGRLRVTARHPDGEQARVMCTVRDASGRDVGARMSRRAGSMIALPSDAEFWTGEEVDAVPALPPGDYSVELRADGFVVCRADVTIEAGNTAVVDRTLTPR